MSSAIDPAWLAKYQPDSHYHQHLHRSYPPTIPDKCRKSDNASDLSDEKCRIQGHPDLPSTLEALSTELDMYVEPTPG
jgi:hypothetical protein